MRLKKILKESEEFNKLEKELAREKWIVKKPRLYRGASSDFEGRIQIKHTSEGGKAMDWEFPDERITQFFFDVEDHCYPNHPKHRNSRHCSTVKDYAEMYGDDLYVIFPSKDSKIAYFRNVDTVVNLFANDRILEDIKYFYDQREKIHKSHREFWIDLYKYFIENRNINILNKYGCLDGMREMVYSSRHKLYSRKDTFDLKQRLKSWYYFKRLRDFFENEFHIGYPPSEGDVRGDEVLVEGDILKVRIDLWNEYQSERGKNEA